MNPGMDDPSARIWVGMKRHAHKRSASDCRGFQMIILSSRTRGSRCRTQPRYRTIGNSMAVPVIRWIGERIQIVHEATD